MNLNNYQQEAVYHIQTPVLVVAGAGSGKTKVITEKIAYLITDCNIDTKSIYAVTFTNKAANEMTSRLNKRLKDGTKGVSVSTFHTLGLKIIRSEYKHLGLKSNFSIFDNQDTLRLIQDLIPNSSQDYKEILTKVSGIKMTGTLPEKAIQDANSDEDLFIAKIYYEYQKALNTYNAVDFEDLILLPLKILKEDIQIKEKWQNKIRYLLVDEYQDTNESQYELMKELTGIRANFTVVGDDHQSVYAFRGAKPQILQHLQDDYHNLKVIKLEQNYRSTNTILQAANALIKNNTTSMDKNLWSDKGKGQPISVVIHKDPDEEAEQIAAEIFHNKIVLGKKYNDFAIMYRSNHIAKLFERALREYDIPYTISGGGSFFSKQEVKDIVAYLKLLCNFEDDLAFTRIINTPKREIGPATLGKVASYAKHRDIPLFYACQEIGLRHYLDEKSYEKVNNFTNFIKSFQEKIDESNDIKIIFDLLDQIEYMSYIEANTSTKASIKKKQENVLELLKWLKRIMANNKEDESENLTLSKSLQKMMLIDILSQNETNNEENAVNLLTIHAAKGLEFNHVYVSGFEEEILPHSNSVGDDAIEEERRVAYVALTRAKEVLSINYCQQRKQAGDVRHCEPSRFLFEIPKEMTDQQSEKPVTQEERQETGKKNFKALKSLLADTRNKKEPESKILQS